MANGSSHKVRHLSVVDQASHTSLTEDPSTRLISAENLTSAQSAQLNRYLQLSKISGTVIGAVCGNESWDVRPVVLRSGKLSIVRFTNPAWIIERAKLDHFKMQIVKLGYEKLIYLSSGESQGQAWIERRYFDALLDGTKSSEHEFFSLHPVIQAQALITLVESNAKKGMIHGHINASNIAIEGESAYLVDHSFRAVGTSAQQSDIAPEVSAGLGVSIQTDIFGLGIILRKVLGSQLGFDHVTLLQRMLSAEPSQRPAFVEIRRAFGLSVEQETKKLASSDDPRIISAGSALPRGKVIQPQSQPLAMAAQPVVAKNPVVVPAPASTHEVKISTNENTLPAKPKAGFGLGLLIIVGLGLLGAVALKTSGYFSDIEVEEPPAVTTQVQKSDAAKLSALWLSSQPSLMSEVARLAVEAGDRVAQSVIVSQALSGRNVPGVRTRLIATAFDPLWEGALSDSDRRLALGLATAGIAPNNLNGLPALGSAHPGVIFAMLVEMEPQSGSKELAAIPLGVLSALPQPYGPMFASLERTGVTSLDDVSAQALAHLLKSGFSADVLKLFFVEKPLQKLIVILPLLSTKGREGAEQVWGTISQHNDLKHFTEWFAAEKASEWDKVSAEQKLALVSGVPLVEGLNQLQVTDLMTFPETRVRASAKDAIITKLGEPNRKMIEFLLSPANRLDRGRILVLITALTFPAEDATPLLMNWFAKQPDAQSVASILVARKASDQHDQLSEQAAEYLLRLKFKPSLTQLEALCTHPVPLARTIAYVNLNAANPKERQLLESMAKIEPDQKIRESIQAKLKTADDIKALNQGL